MASDIPSNPRDSSLEGELVSRPFAIAGTPPRVDVTDSDTIRNKVEVKFSACVTAGSIAASEYSIDGGDWRLVFPVDGVADSKCEPYRMVTPDLAAGDRNGNTGITKTLVRIP